MDARPTALLRLPCLVVWARQADVTPGDGHTAAVDPTNIRGTGNSPLRTVR